MKSHFRKNLLVCLVILGALRVQGGEEQDLIAVLQSGASQEQKAAACARLRVMGDAAAVQPLARLLTEDGTAHAARYALEGLNYPEAVAALRDALGRTSGLMKAGIIDSLGWKRDTASVKLLAPLLPDLDLSVSSAAARALGRIGGAEAVAALRSVGEKATLDRRIAAQEALLAGAESALGAGDAAGAAAIYRDLYSAGISEPIRVAGWRGQAIADASQRQKLVLAALTGQDRGLERAAEKVLAEVRDAGLVEACLGQWDQLPANGELAVLRARLPLGGDLLPRVLTAAESPHPAVRVAAWRALGDLDAAQAIPALARAAARGEAAEKAAARETLERMRGPAVHDGLVEALKSAETHERAELLAALGERGDALASGALLRYAAASEPEEVRFAALESLRKIAVSDTLSPLLALLVKSGSEAESEPVMKALDAVCRASRDKDQATRTTLAAFHQAQPAERQRLLPLLPELGTAAALEAAEAAATDANPEVAKEAVRALAHWPTAAPAQRLLALARADKSPTVQVLAVRSGIEVAGQEPDLGRRLALLKEALKVATRPGEKKLALAQIGSIPSPEALQVVEQVLNDPGVGDEAALASIAIAEKLAASQPGLAREAAGRVMTQSKQPEVLSRAWKLRGAAAAGPFIRDWAVAGPFSKPGVNGAIAVFDVAFPPEKSGETVPWRAVPAADQVNLAGLFPGRESCAAYLRSRLVAAQDTMAVLLLGSDDGVKAWVNGEVVHANNVDRGDVPDQDVAIIELKKGANDLMLKITQGGAGWSCHARVVGVDGQPMKDLRLERPE